MRENDTLRKNQTLWQRYLERPETNPLSYEHPEQYGAVVMENTLCFYLEFEGKVLPGSGMIIPKAHRPTVFDLTPDEWAATYELLHSVKAHLDATFNPDGYSVGWNVEPVGGQHIPQAHLHVVSRFADESYAGRGIRYWLKQEDNLRPETP